MTTDKARLRELFARADELRVAVLGDFCLDVYWDADMRLSELSRETPHHPLPIVRERMQPGAAGNVACNLAALKPKAVYALTVLGRDWRGRELEAALAAAGVDGSALLRSGERVTNAYIKPMRHGISDTVYEDPRLDFENRAPLNAADEQRLIDMLRLLAPELDALYVCDQLALGCVTDRVRDELARLGDEGLKIVVDSRDRVASYRAAIVKPNELELARAMGGAEPAETARALSARTGRPVVVTLGERGCVVADERGAVAVPARKVEPPVDICGAGDTFGSALTLLHTAGARLEEACGYAAVASAVTVKKLQTTGTASREEMLEGC